MLRSLKRLEHRRIQAIDGPIGRVVDFLVDDRQWRVRHVVVDTSSVFKEHLLIPPASIRGHELWHGRLRVDLTRGRILSCPTIDKDLPVSLQYERAEDRYYGYPDYWDISRLLDGGGYRAPVEGHLRSTRQLRGYTILGSDAPAGHVGDWIVEDETWSVRYMMLARGLGWFGRKLLVAPERIGTVSWPDHQVLLTLSRQAIQASPRWRSGRLTGVPDQDLSSGRIVSP
jgi:hypothetical protein